MSEELLNEALFIVQERGKSYDKGAERSLKSISMLWSAYLDRELSETDVASMMILLKISRQKHSPAKRDHWVDVAGYSALGYESAVDAKAFDTVPVFPDGEY